ncbi:enolase C-terminal domain-like protein [Iamia majanohamensis]|uniref:Enolase C-terminal domain-like protein n=1 Tax=Iamia majanohamensis TaxID=467976 RepID=A0AAE9YCF3_9ACTN|nr:enolase C-terminal domain-like protein [Iamia majanohamensis]WCO65231.1 enolase C-terminal domain-like protein [Iamia majanohamensis]
MTGPAPVARVTLHRVALPLLRPHLAAHGREDRREVVLVEVTDAEGVAGWGECPTLARPGYAPEWTDGAWWVLRRMLVPALLEGRGVGVVGHPMASGAVRDALLDLRLRRAGEGPAALLGPLADRVAFGVAVGFTADVEATARAAADAVAAGAALVVLKVRPGWCAAPVAAVRRALPDLLVAVDGNGSFDATTLGELQRAAEEGLAFVEQPMAPGDHDGARRAVARLDVPVALDEAVAAPADLDAAVALGTGSMLTVKPSRLGGVEAAAAASARAAAAGWAVHAGGMLESGVGRAAARALAGRPEVAGPALAGPTALLFADDVVDPVPAGADGTVPVPAGPGLAPPPDPDRLRALTVASWTRDAGPRTPR